MKRLILPLAVILSLASCTVTEDLSLSGNGGTSYAYIHVEDFFIDVLNDFSTFIPESSETIMDSAVRTFSEQLDAIEAVTSVSWEKTGSNDYTLSFSYSDLAQLLQGMGAEEQTLLRQEGNSLSFHLDIGSYQELKRIVPFLADPNFEVYGPEYNQGMSEADYLDMIYFLLGEDGPDAISNGLVTLSIAVPGTITETVNCTAADGSTALFSFPIIDFLLLNEPISFSVSWE